MANKKQLTSVRIDSDLWVDFKLHCIKYKYSFQKLAESAIDLYLNDEEFRKKIYNHKIKLNDKDS